MHDPRAAQPRRSAIHAALTATVLGLFPAGCGDDGPPAGGDGGPLSCPMLEAPLGAPGDPVAEDWDGFAQGFFDRFCVRCHHSALVGDEARSFAPAGYDFDQRASVRTHLEAIRRVVGVHRVMPPAPPHPSCEDRRLLVRWIDVGAPGL